MALRAPAVVDDLAARCEQVARELQGGALLAALERFEAVSHRTERLLAFLVLARDLVAPRDGALAVALDGCVHRVLGVLDQIAGALEAKDLVAVAMLTRAALTVALEQVPALAARVEAALREVPAVA